MTEIVIHPRLLFVWGRITDNRLIRKRMIPVITIEMAFLFFIFISFT